MAREDTLRFVDFARRGAELWAVMVAEVRTDGLTPDEARDLREARDLLHTAAKALWRLMSRSTSPSAGKGSLQGP